MEASWVGAVASLVSALIVAITAVAAFIQIRHVRNSNEITVYLKMVERFDLFGSTGTFDRIATFVARIALEPELRRGLTEATLPVDAYETTGVLLFIEHLSTLVVTDGVSERLVLAEYCDNIVELWHRLREFVYLRRIGRGKYYAVAFEDLAMRAQRYIAAGQMERLYGNLSKDPAMASFAAPAAEAEAD